MLNVNAGVVPPSANTALTLSGQLAISITSNVAAVACAKVPITKSTPPTVATIVTLLLFASLKNGEKTVKNFSFENVEYCMPYASFGNSLVNNIIPKY